MIAGWMAGRQRLHGAQLIEDGPSADGQDRREGQDDEALKRRSGEGRRQRVEQWLGRLWDTRLQAAFRVAPRSAIGFGLAAGPFGYLQPGRLRYSAHASLLAQESKGGLSPSIPAKRLVFV